ncbi:MAG: dihydroorotate dehydrogenase electron transfer subunit [Alphaproteobacteria bacterium CG_4_10_14_0_2_um_filter_63_37]|nr:MAG: hypothetical protein AUJ55_03395 [Proteobacteria bacterium CG1_02_64_396]PJA25495.1 MAG: dihydroorotate dehydrogenase electron transfer subunit [Alphaproteobacteria bacterium CG_4_10_14_0_2_um_filter_63_37]
MIAIRQTVAEVIETQPAPEGYGFLTLRCPEIARDFIPGHFVHIRVPGLDLRRPFSIQDADPVAGTLELFYKVVGKGSKRLGQCRVGERLNLLGPIGAPFPPIVGPAVLVGGGIGVAPLIGLAHRAAATGQAGATTLLMGQESAFSFETDLSKLDFPGVSVSLGLSVLEELGIPSRLSRMKGGDGVHAGLITEPLRAHLAARSDRPAVYTCGPTVMMRAVASVAQEFGLTCYASMEAHMACGVGGCAGCVIPLNTERGPAMKRVCVDGPVFDAASIDWEGCP